MATINQGHITEGILTAAIAARFISKTKKITEQDVVSLIKKLGPAKQGGKLIERRFMSPNKNIDITDLVKMAISLPTESMSAFLDTKNYKTKEFIGLVRGAIVYANSDNVMKWADKLYTNNMRNVIEVRSEGLINQRGTKVDLFVLVDKEKTDINLSIKANRATQIGQVTGASVDSLETFFKPLGVNFSQTLQIKMQRLINKGEVPEAICIAYTDAVRQMEKLVKRDIVGFRTKIAKFIRYHATRNQKDVVLVHIRENYASLYKFENIQQKLQGMDMQFIYTENDTSIFKEGKLPQIRIVNANEKTLLTLRSRATIKDEKLKFFNVVEKGPLVTELLSKKVT
jgi:hypothetical protein